ncbi:Lipase [Giardia muris]|uniref:sn-1-specific diacylglycerol lipase n=1 Tax=Giardia muris TaxID=5742 RepID=A0A4Z1STW6_GIAMU|nr:Lipase [Giardia muris]|eukprot:TNJ27078.1 Lipase [Giardia muris]
MDQLTSLTDAMRAVRIAFQQFKEVRSETHRNRLLLLKRMGADRVQGFPNRLSPEEYPTLSAPGFVAELLRYCRAAYAVYGSYETRYTMNHTDWQLPSFNSGLIRKQARRYYKARDRLFGRSLEGIRARNLYELKVFAASVSVDPQDVIQFTTAAKYFMPCTAVYLDHRSYEIVVAVRGSYAFADFVTDLFCVPTVFQSPPERFEMLIKESARNAFILDLDAESMVSCSTKGIDKLARKSTNYVTSQDIKKKTARWRRSKDPILTPQYGGTRERNAEVEKFIRANSLSSLVSEQLYSSSPTSQRSPPDDIVDASKAKRSRKRVRLQSDDILIHPVTQDTKYFGHAGIYAAATYVYHDTHTLLLDYLARYPNYYLTFTGHSLGGAVAALLGWFWINLIPRERIRVISFSGPPCASPALNKLFQDNGFINISLQNEFGPRIGSRNVLFAFRRLGLLSEILRRKQVNQTIKSTRLVRRAETFFDISQQHFATDVQVYPAAQKRQSQTHFCTLNASPVMTNPGTLLVMKKVSKKNTPTQLRDVEVKPARRKGTIGEEAEDGPRLHRNEGRAVDGLSSSISECCDDDMDPDSIAIKIAQMASFEESQTDTEESDEEWNIDPIVLQRFRDLYDSQLVELGRMDDKILTWEYTQYRLNYVCPAFDLEIFPPGTQYVISFTFGNDVISFKELRERNQREGVPQRPALRLFQAPLYAFDELLFNREMFAHHLLIYQGILLLQYNLHGRFPDPPWDATIGEGACWGDPPQTQK